MADKDFRARRAVSEMDRVQLEDKHYRLMEENMVLKKHARSQEEKMKRMATKLLRLTADEKKEVRKGTHSLTASQLRQRDIEIEEIMEDFQLRVQQLEKQNASLKSRTLVLRQQLEVQGKRRTPYDHIPSRVSTGRGRPKKIIRPTTVYIEERIGTKKAMHSSKAVNTEDGSPIDSDNEDSPFRAVDTKDSPSKIKTSNVGVQQRVETGHMGVQSKGILVSHAGIQLNPSVGHASVQTSDSCHRLLEEVRQDNHELERQMLQMKSDLQMLEAENNSNKEKLRLKCMQLDEEKLISRQALQTQIAALEREKAELEMEVTRRERETRDAENRLQSMTSKCSTIENNLAVIKNSHSKVLDEMEKLNQDLKEERCRTSQLEIRLRSHDNDQQTISSLEEMVADLRRERDVLREASRDLASKEEMSIIKHKAKIKSFQEQITALEEAASTENSNRSKTLKELSAERELSSRLDGELRKTRDMYIKLKEEYTELKEKLKFFEKESSLDWSEVEEALQVLRDKKSNEKKQAKDVTEPVTNQQEVQELQAWHADTVNELDKTRKLLQIQHSINKDYKSEVESLKDQLAQQKQQHEAQLQEYIQLIDIKAARVKKLEVQLKEIAYGTRPYRLDTSKFEYADEDEGESVELERGQNLLQFCISQVILSPEALSHLSTSIPALFVTLYFSDYETQVTPIMLGPKPSFNYTASFVVTIDDAFLQLLQKDSIHLEINQAFGYKYQILAVARVKCLELISSSGGKVHGKAVMTGVESMQECVSVGGVEYWMTMKLPITQTAKHYQDRTKVIALMDSINAPPTSSPSLLQSYEGPDYNELSVTIINCQGLPAQDPVQFPSPYVMYKFYSFPDYDTAIIQHSTSPHYVDIRTFPLSMAPQLDQYLKSENLDLYVFDDDVKDEDETGPTYLGLAQVSLQPLSQGKPISGTFQLKQPSGDSGGFIEISMKWKLPYTVLNDLPPSMPEPHPPTSKQPPPAEEESATNKLSSSSPSQPSTESESSLKSKRKPASSQLPKESATDKSSASSTPSQPSTESESSPKAKRKPTSSQSKALDHHNIIFPSIRTVAPEETEEGLKLDTSVESGVKTSEHKSYFDSDSDETLGKTYSYNDRTMSHEFDSQSVLETEVYSNEESSEHGSVKEGVHGSKKIGVHSNVKVGVRGSKQAGIRGSKQAGVRSSKRAAVRARKQAGVRGSKQANTHDSEGTGVHASSEGSSEHSDSIHDSTEDSGVHGGIKTDVHGREDTGVYNDEWDDTEDSNTTSTKNSRSNVPHVTKADIPNISVTGPDSDSRIETSTESEWRGEGDTISMVSVTELSEEDGIDEGEDTMFEETLRDELEGLSGLSEHSSDELPTTFQAPPQQRGEGGSIPTAKDAHAREESLSEDSNPITSSEEQGEEQEEQEEEEEEEESESEDSNTMSITVESFTLEPGASIADDDTIKNIFIEYQFLNFDNEELETPLSLPLPQEGETVEFNFRKEFKLDSEQLILLKEMLKPGDPSEGKITFTVVSDPEDQDADCKELGSATVDLTLIQIRRADVIEECIDVFSLEDDPEVIGYVTVSVKAVDVLKSLDNR